jgi:A/G-specific adenine glycosylase
MVKKTGANTVNQFLPHFLDRYGDMHSLDNSTFEELEEALAPLGLSAQRARQLKSLAEALVQSYGGRIPDERDELLQLPGIGEYTAGAVLSFAYEKPEAIVDTNVARIITRFYGIEPSRYEARRSPEVWEKAWQLVSQDSKLSHKINWALLDLGALICKSHKPKCDECPLSRDCTFATLQNAPN